MDSFGVEFVNFVGQFGYDRILKVLGRHMRDFLNGLDNLHEYLRFSYPKLKPPSFFLEMCIRMCVSKPSIVLKARYYKGLNFNHCRSDVIRAM
ncbi:unnamed protein product [Candidula unifasciata]|uniref:Heme NO-binding domain-containing protein n=1 Tax=Candidula unifasciata TaxID=100452 RepID=A0A8S3ZQ57_9EUPU|nr:unnamed protein product [Candidula unifasciata]